VFNRDDEYNNKTKKTKSVSPPAPLLSSINIMDGKHKQRCRHDDEIDNLRQVGLKTAFHSQVVNSQLPSRDHEFTSSMESNISLRDAHHNWCHKYNAEVHDMPVTHCWCIYACHQRKDDGWLDVCQKPMWHHLHMRCGGLGPTKGNQTRHPTIDIKGTCIVCTKTEPGTSKSQIPLC